MQPDESSKAESILNKENIFDTFFSIDAFLSMKRSQIAKEIEDAVDKTPWYRLFLALSADTVNEVYLTYFYYREIYIPNALAVQERLERDFESSKLRELFENARLHIALPRTLDRVVDELIYSAYISINHKLEDVLKHIQKHSTGERHGLMQYPTDNLYDYVALLKESFDFELYKFFTDYIPHLQRIRLIANCIKHTNGYPNVDDARDRILLTLVNQEADSTERLSRPPEQFYDDALYASLCTNFFFTFVKRVHTVFQFLIETNENDAIDTKKEAEVTKLRNLCNAVKNAATNADVFNRLIGYKS